MKVFFQQLKSSILNRFQKNNNPSYSDINTELFEDLTPKNNIDEYSQYLDVLNRALNNQENKNIALTGSYGSGKSSIIKTYQKQKEGIYTFLNISLASFKDEEVKNENVLEKSILQQIFYKVSNKTLPYSRFKRIKNIKWSGLFIQVLLFITFLLIGLQLFYPTLLNDFFNKTLIKKSLSSGEISKITNMGILLIIFLGYLFYQIMKFLNFIGRNLKFSKLALPNATIEVDKESESSIFDKYLDEILYFFEVTKYDVVIFEDLDRFNNLDIFEKLRGLNTLINNAEQINRRVVFLYAIKDDIFGEEDNMFSSRNRTKFFDFIIPVIPVINSSNSGQILRNKLKSAPGAEDITENFINDITIYIDDMRILINICNEYNLYKGILGRIDLNPNNLLAMIVYKNIYPKDFSELQFNQGMVHDVLHNKSTFIFNLVADIENELTRVENDIIQVEREVWETLEELRVVYAEGLGLNDNNNTTQVHLDHQQFNFQNWRGAQFFERLKVARVFRYYGPRGSNNPTREDIATIFGTKENYFERERIIKIKEENRLDELKERLEMLNREKQEVMSLSLKDVISKSSVDDIFSGKIRDKKLLIFLIRNGYIDELYPQYITYFYPGSITTEDMKFIMSVKDQEPLPFTYSLSNLYQILKRLHVNDFRRKEILNFDLLEYISANKSEYELFYDLTMNQLVDKSNTSVSFIDYFKNITSFKKELFQALGRKWPNFWNYIDLESNYSKSKKDEYLVEIIEFVEIEEIISMNIQGILPRYISSKSDFLTLFPKEEIHSKVNSVLYQLKVKFLDLQQPTNENIMFDFIYENNLYVINNNMINLFMIVKTGEVKIPNYSNINQSNLEPLKNYTNENIEEYIENIFLKLQQINETEETIIELLARDDINKHLKEKIISRFEGKIKKISSLDTTLWEKIISDNKIVSSWDNVLMYYSEFKMLSEPLLKFLNIDSNCNELSDFELDDIQGYDEEILMHMSSEIMQSNEISEICFNILAKSLIRWSSFPLGDLSINKVKVLINNDKLTLSNDNFMSLKSNFKPLHLLLVERNIELFINNQNSFDLDTKDMISLLDSENINENQKINIINNISEELHQILTQDLTFSKLIAKHIINQECEVSESMLNSIMNTKISINEKVSFLAIQIKSLDNEKISAYLKRLNSPYSEIAENGKRPIISNSNSNMLLLQELNKKDYISSWKEEDDKLRVNTKLK